MTEWQDVATYGYPIGIVSGPPDAINLNIRCHQGYIQRKIPANNLGDFDKHSDSFELSFLLGKGLSGAPLFYHSAASDVVIGICVGSIRSEQAAEEHVEIQDGDTKYVEKKVYIEQFGVAQDIDMLAQWKPSLLDGMSLYEFGV